MNWVEVSTHGISEVLLQHHPRAFQRSVEDGHLSAIVAREPPGWHLSISHRTNENPPKPGRLPTWEEIKEARYSLLPDRIYAAIILPPQNEYVNCHETTMHLWQIS